MACDQSEIVIEGGGLDDPDVEALLAHDLTEMRADLPPEASHVLPARSLRPADIRFFAARERLGGFVRRKSPGGAG